MTSDLHKPDSTLEKLNKRNNPNNDPTGINTDRCEHCGSKEMWDDGFARGCDCCGALLGCI